MSAAWGPREPKGAAGSPRAKGAPAPTGLTSDEGARREGGALKGAPEASGGKICRDVP